MQSPNLWAVSMWASGRHLEVPVRPRQIHNHFEVKLRVIGQTSKRIGRWVIGLRDCYLTSFSRVTFWEVPYTTLTKSPSSRLSTLITSAGRGFGPGSISGTSGNKHHTMSPGAGSFQFGFMQTMPLWKESCLLADACPHPCAEP